MQLITQQEYRTYSSITGKTDKPEIDVLITASSAIIKQVLGDSLTNEVPEDIKLATALLTKYFYKEEYNKTSVAMGGQQVSYTVDSLPPYVKTILLLHRDI